MIQIMNIVLAVLIKNCRKFKEKIIQNVLTDTLDSSLWVSLVSGTRF